MKRLIVCCLLTCCCCSNAFATNDNDNDNDDSGVFAHECSAVDLATHKVNVCHVPEGIPENRHTICVDDDTQKKPFNGHSPGVHGGDYLGLCLADPTPSPTPTATPSPSPTPGGENPTPTPTPTPTPNTPTPTPTPTPEDKKITICHLTPSDENLKAIDITISVNALEAHLAHGDHVGACVFDCAGAPFGQALDDACGVCGGDGSSCADCQGNPNGEAQIDACGVCNGNGTTCLGCDQVANSGKTLDDCGVCGGDSSTCKDCKGVPNGEAVIDSCGVCDGQSNTCLDCAGVPNGTSKPDSCGVCNGNNSCVDCLGIPNGPNKTDSCGVCGGSNSCLDCSGIPNGGTLIDQCGLCGGPGGSTVKISINKKKLIALADLLLIKKTIPYFAGAQKCDRSFSKLAGKGTTAAKKVHREIVLAIKQLKTEVLLCPGQCERDINKELLKLINKLAKVQYKFAAQAQHAGRAACKNDGPGLKLTKPIENNIHTIVNNCPNKACK